MKFDFDFINHEKTTFCVLRFISYSFTASDGSEESTAGRVVAPCSMMAHRGLRSKEARRARKQEYRLRQTTSHSSLLVARKVMYPANSTKRLSRLTRPTLILKLRNVQIYIRRMQLHKLVSSMLP